MANRLVEDVPGTAEYERKQLRELRAAPTAAPAPVDAPSAAPAPAPEASAPRRRTKPADDPAPNEEAPVGESEES